jgi:lambda repressor-like predicted transcriptional regulator
MTDHKHELTATDANPVKEPRISKRMQKVLTALATKGMTQREAAKQAGMSETYLSVALRKPEIQMFIARKMRETIAVGGLRASARLVELIDAGSEHVSADVSKHTLAIAGIKPSSEPVTQLNINIRAGYVIDLRTDEEIAAGKAIDVSPTTRD